MFRHCSVESGRVQAGSVTLPNDATMCKRGIVSNESCCEYRLLGGFYSVPV